MQYTLVDLLKPEHVRVGIAAADDLEAIRAVNQALVASGHTLLEFGEDACAREATFPTGLPTAPIAVAIPHADPTHVLSSALAIGTLSSPVKFSQMGTDGSIRLDVQLEFLLAIKESEKQVEMIQQLMAVIQNPDVLEAMLRTRDAAGILDLIRATLSR